MSNQQTFGRSRPDKAFENKYRQQLQDLLDEMQKDVKKELTAYLKRNVAQDAVSDTWAQVMKFLRQKWYKR